MKCQFKNQIKVLFQKLFAILIKIKICFKIVNNFFALKMPVNVMGHHTSVFLNSIQIALTLIQKQLPQLKIFSEVGLLKPMMSDILDNILKKIPFSHPQNIYFGYRRPFCVRYLPKYTLFYIICYKTGKFPFLQNRTPILTKSKAEAAGQRSSFPFHRVYENISKRMTLIT